jgi:hypothetical protein
MDWIDWVVTVFREVVPCYLTDKYEHFERTKDRIHERTRRDVT